MIARIRRWRQGRRAPEQRQVQPGLQALLGLGRGYRLDGDRVRGPNPRQALMFPAYKAAITLLSESLAKLPLQVRVTDSTTGLSEVEYTPIARMLNSDWSSGVGSVEARRMFWQQVFHRGWGLIYVQRTPRGAVEQMHVLNSESCQMLWVDGELAYRYNDAYFSGTLLGSDVISIQWLPPEWLPVAPQGFTRTTASRTVERPVASYEVGWAAIKSGLLALSHAADALGRGLTPTHAYVLEDAVGEDDLEKAKEAILEAYRKMREGRSENIVMSGGIKLQPLSISARDAQVVEQRRQAVEDVARLMNVPASFLQENTGTQTGRTVEQRSTNLQLHTLEPWIRLFEEEATRVVFGRRSPRSVALDTQQLRLIKERADSLTKMTGGAAWLTPNEARREVGLPPLEGADELINMPGAPGAPEQEGPPPEPDLDPDAEEG